MTINAIINATLMKRFILPIFNTQLRVKAKL